MEDSFPKVVGSKPLAFDTLSVKNEPPRGPVHSMTVPVYLTSTYLLESAEHGAKLSNQLPIGNSSPWLYSRWGNPTTDAAARTLSNLEGAQGTILTASGMSAIFTTFMSLLKSGDQVIAPRPVYSGTHELLMDYLCKYGIEATFVDGREVDAFRKAITPKTKILYGETPANPTMSLLDLEEFAKLGKEKNIITVVDSTFASPCNQLPIKLGIDIVIHSCTKYIGGHHDLLMGAVCCASESLYNNIYQHHRIFGAIPSPFESYLLLRGMKTLSLRVERANSNALAVAAFLEKHPKISFVHYPGLPSHPQYQLAKKQMKGFGGMIAFDVKGGAEGGRKLIESVKIINLAVSLGGVESLIEQASTITHVMVPREERLKAGITDGLIRLSVGVEDVDDLINDLSNALDQI